MRPDPEQLAAIPLFDALTDDQRRQIADWFLVRSVARGIRLAGEFGAEFRRLQQELPDTAARIEKTMRDRFTALT